MVDFRNVNTLWASILVTTLQRLGLTTAVICPGSRSAPLAVAFAGNQAIESIPILDERSAAFFALGIAKKSGLPVAVVCTSGTAGANFYPAIIEAKESRVPLLILTADRPPELRDCHAGQAIDQVKLYGNFPNWQAELALPKPTLERLQYLRQTLIHAWERALFPSPGPVHLNLPFRNPLAPVSDPAIEALQDKLPLEDFFAFINPIKVYSSLLSQKTLDHLILEDLQNCSKGLIIIGTVQPQDPHNYCQIIGQISQHLGWPVLAEGLSPLRNYQHLNPYLISTYDLILRNPHFAQKLAPEIVIQLGELPTSKELRTWLESTQPQRWIVDPSPHNFDPLHGRTLHLRTSLESFAFSLSQFPDTSQLKYPEKLEYSSFDYLQLWCDLDHKVRQTIDQKMLGIDRIIEPKVAWLLSQSLPPETPLFIANSMPVRDVEFFWRPNSLKIQPFFNRGANGIDGTLSTTLGIAHRHQSSVLLTGDLALLHDTNGFLIKNHFTGHLTILLINNNGGGIFEMLPVAQFDPPFETYFATPQTINFSHLCQTYGVEYQKIESWDELQQQLTSLPKTGIRVLEVPTNRRFDASWRQAHLRTFANF